MNRRVHFFSERAPMRRCLLATIAGSCLLGGCGEESPEQLMMKSMQKAVQGDDAAALALLDHSLALAPNDTSLLFVRGSLHDTLGNPSAAIADYEKAIALAPYLEPGIAMQLESLREQVSVSSRTHSTRVTFVPAPSDPTGPTIERVTFCASRPRGYRDYEPQPSARYHAGDTAWIYLDVGNLESRRRFDGDLENALRQSLTLRGPGGTVLSDTVVIDEVLVIESGVDGDRLFLRNHIDIPAAAPAGVYRVELVVVDKFAGAMTTAGATFTVD